MQRAPATIEEQLLLKAIKEECPWESLPKRLQVTLSSKEEWHRRVIEHCVKKRLPWNTCFARKVCKEGEYYEDMMRFLRLTCLFYYLQLFPYHLAEYVCRVMRVSPFRYYCDMIFEVMRNEQPYDSIPNFSAADALRLTGIGRNEFIDIMNKCRSKSSSHSSSFSARQNHAAHRSEQQRRHAADWSSTDTAIIQPPSPQHHHPSAVSKIAKVRVWVSEIEVTEA
ncbi:hypothetical protein C1H46_001694 [Malus baccata]|uniref:FAM91 N-terminal domain-containing protein n=1 Tax=Malus baccata TaxID=106549 RepID=A0A540NNQ9_MALBA|nr:hypothetical protein C1H46_001694 [Malus baccata]